MDKDKFKENENTKKVPKKSKNILKCEVNYKNINQTVSKLHKYYNIEEKSVNNY